MKKKVVVVGGGFSGLTTAYYLCRAGFSVEVHEASHSWGGVLQTHLTKFGMIETAANGFLRTQTLVDLCEDLGVFLLEAGEKSRRRLIYRDGPRRWPLKIRETLGFLPALAHLLVQKTSKRPLPGQSLSDWARQNLGSPALDYLVGPALQGVYADDSEKMSARLVLQKFFPEEKDNLSPPHCFPRRLVKPCPGRWRPRRLRLGRSHMVAPEKGMGELIDRLVDWLGRYGVGLYLNSSYVLPKEKKWAAPHVICTGLKGFFHLVKGHPVQDELVKNKSFSEVFSGIETLSLTSTTIFFERSSKDLQAFGCLFPRTEGFFHLGVLFNDCIFDNRSSKYRSETWIGGGAFYPTAHELSDTELLEKVLQDRQHLQRDFNPQGQAREVVQFFQSTRWPDVLPSYGKALEEFLQGWQPSTPLYLNGNYLGEIGLSGLLNRASQIPQWIKDSRTD